MQHRNNSYAVASASGRVADLDEELKRTNQELRRATSDLDAFAYSATHELQEPVRMVAICGQLLQLRYGTHLNGEGSELISRILEGAHRMEALVNDLLAYSRVAKSVAGPVPNVNANTVLAGVMQLIGERLQQESAVVTADELPVVCVHETHLAQLFEQLIRNAVTYRGSETPRIHIAAVPNNGSCLFSVSDNGIGIDEKYKTQIFGLFKRLHSRDDYPGNGVGLAICQRITEQYGGRIWLDKSTLGEGSVFCFALPDQDASV